MIKIAGLFIELIIKGILQLLGFLILPAFVVCMSYGFIMVFFNIPIDLILSLFDMDLHEDVYGLLSDTFWKYFIVSYFVVGYLAFLALVIYADWGQHWKTFLSTSVTYWKLKKALKGEKE